MLFKDFKRKIDVKLTGYKRYIAVTVNVILVFVLLIGGDVLFKKFNLNRELFFPCLFGLFFVAMILLLVIYYLFFKKKNLSKEETYKLGKSKFPNIAPIPDGNDVSKISEVILDGLEVESHRDYEISIFDSENPALFSQFFWRVRAISDDDIVCEDKYEMVNCDLYRFETKKKISAPVICSFNKKIIKDHAESIYTENLEFNEKFYVKAGVAESAFYVLTPHVLERFVNLIQLFPKSIFCFKDNHLYVIFYDSGAFKKHGIVYNELYLEQLATIDNNFRNIYKELDSILKN